MLCAVLSFCLCACSNSKNAHKSAEQNRIIISESKDDSVNGYRVQQPQNNLRAAEQKADNQPRTASAPAESKDDSQTLYYANTKTKKFHRSDCGIAQRTNNENLLITDNREELTQSGYSPCKKCNP